MDYTWGDFQRQESTSSTCLSDVYALIENGTAEEIARGIQRERNARAAAHSQIDDLEAQIAALQDQIREASEESGWTRVHLREFQKEMPEVYRHVFFTHDEDDMEFDREWWLKNECPTCFRRVDGECTACNR